MHLVAGVDAVGPSSFSESLIQAVGCHTVYEHLVISYDTGINNV